MYRDPMVYQRHLHATHLGCRTLTLRYAAPVALTDCDTPSMSHMHFATPLPCLKRYRQCDRRFATQPSCRMFWPAIPKVYRRTSMRHSRPVARSHYDTPIMSHSVVAIHHVCRTHGLRHPDRATSGSLSASSGTGGSRNRHRSGLLWRETCLNWHSFFWLYYR